MKKLRRWFFSKFRFYRRLEVIYITYAEADRILREQGLPPDDRPFWRLAEEEDDNFHYGLVYLERVERIR